MKSISSFFKDRHGKWAVIQPPNALLVIWILLLLTPLIVHDATIRSNINQLKNAVLFAWAYLELVSGTSKLRQVLGGFILIMSVVSYFA